MLPYTAGAVSDPMPVRPIPVQSVRPPDAAKSRLAYIDWMRGLACILMFQTHCYDSWLGGAARQSRFFMYSQLGGTFPAPLFLFLAGISFALVTEKLWRKNLPPRRDRAHDHPARRGNFRLRSAVPRAGIRHLLGMGAQERSAARGHPQHHRPLHDADGCLVLDSLARLLPGAPLLARFLPEKACLERVEGCGPPPRAAATALAAAGTALLLSLLTPDALDGLAPALASLAAGVLHQRRAQPGHAASLAVPHLSVERFRVCRTGGGISSCKASGRALAKGRFSSLLGAAGVVLVELARWLDAQPRQVYPVYDYWHTSPSFFLIRLGMLLVIVTASYAWCRWGAAQWGFSPVIQLGQASLLVYWVHIEFVYGRVSILPKRSRRHWHGFCGTAGDHTGHGRPGLRPYSDEGPRGGSPVFLADEEGSGRVCTNNGEIARNRHCFIHLRAARPVQNKAINSLKTVHLVPQVKLI